MPERILVLCTGNSCRSQMAEGYLRHLGKNRYVIVSAGLEPSNVDPNAIHVMKEDGIDISQHTSKDVNQFIGQQFDYIITVCDHASERCPYFPGDAKRIHWSLEDPAAATGPKEQVLSVFRKVREQIRLRIEEFLK